MRSSKNRNQHITPARQFFGFGSKIAKFIFQKSQKTFWWADAHVIFFFCYDSRKSERATISFREKTGVLFSWIDGLSRPIGPLSSPWRQGGRHAHAREGTPIFVYG